LEKAIRSKRRVIALLQEQKQAIIHRAVTRGLDPNVKLKESGVSWLGRIPEHWEVRKLKHITRFVNGLPFKPGDWKDVGVPIIRIQNLNGSETFNYTDRVGLPRELLIQPGDLMFAWSGNRGTSFGSFEWTRPFPGYLNQHIFKLVGYTLPKRYFYYLLRAVTRHVEEQAGGIIGLVHVTKPELGSVHVPIAPIEVAEAIAQEIDINTAQVNRAIARYEREITLLREYRTRLTADVVTGKLDVRAAAAQLPEEAAEESLPDPELPEEEPELEEVE
jgi:type I restriction enzyme S subunit